jgi:hypothetical protein
MTAPVMMGITSPTGSHLATLEAEVAKLPHGAIVMEHGAGLYSSPYLARCDVRVVCAEDHPGWAEWARWLYGDKGEIIEMAKRLVARMSEASLLFVDGDARQRGMLVSAAIERRVPVIIAHDTQEAHWHEYGYRESMFRASGYRVTSDTELHRTTLWTLL